MLMVWLYCLYSNLLQFITSGPVIAMEIMGDEAVSAWRELLGPTDSDAARREATQSLRARFGTDGTQNAGHGSDSLASAARVGNNSCQCCMRQAPDYSA